MGFGRTNRAAWSGVCNNPAEPARPSPGLFVITSRAGLDVRRQNQRAKSRLPAERPRPAKARPSHLCDRRHLPPFRTTSVLVSHPKHPLIPVPQRSRPNPLARSTAWGRSAHEHWRRRPWRPLRFLDGGLQAVREVCRGSEAKATALAPLLQKTQIGKRDEIVPRRLMRNAVGCCVRLEAIASLRITESIAQERELAMIEVGRSLDEFFDVTDLFDLRL